MIERIEIGECFEKYYELPIIDVRSPGEFLKGHIPEAHNIPLFSDDERAQVGTVYKRKTKEKAIELGYTFVNPKLDYFISASEKIAPKKEVLVHCWRGGMRSQSFAEHLMSNGFTKVYVIEKGYKAFRNHVLDFFNQPFPFIVLGGYTGSGKTEILHELKTLGSQVIDLEGLANHKGSAFGGIGQEDQPTTEHFENLLFIHLFKMNKKQAIWIEDESMHIGRVFLPKALFNQIRSQKGYFIDIPIVERAKFLVQAYGNLDKELLKESVNKIAKRLGPLNTKNSLLAIDQNDFHQVALLTLTYYDKSYNNGFTTRSNQNIIKLPMRHVSAVDNAIELLAKLQA